MIVSLCSVLFDYSGDHLLDIDAAGSNLSLLSRRVSRTATLDGGALLIDNGFAVADATFTLNLLDISAAQHAALSASIKRHSLFTLSFRQGCFLGVVEAVDEAQSFKIRFLVSTDITGG